MRKLTLICIIFLMTITVSSFNEDNKEESIASFEASSSLPVGLSQLLQEDTKSEIEAELLSQSNSLSIIAMPIGYLGAEEAIKRIDRDTAIQERRAKIALEAQKKEEENREKILAQQNTQEPKNTEEIKTIIQEEIISDKIEFIDFNLNKVQNNYDVNFILRNIGEELRVGEIHFTLHFANNEKIAFSEIGAYRFRIQVPKSYTLISRSKMLEYAKLTEPLYISVTLINDNGQIFMRKNLLINKEG